MGLIKMRSQIIDNKSSNNPYTQGFRCFNNIGSERSTLIFLSNETIFHSMKSKKRMNNDAKMILEHIEEMEKDPARNYLVAYDQERYQKKIETANEQKLEELIQLFELVDNVYFRALSHYANWKLQSGETRYKEAVKAAESFENGADLALQSEFDFLFHQNLEMALFINRSLNYKEEVKRLVSKTIENMKVLYEKKKHRWNIEQIRLFLKYGDPKEKDKVEEVFTLTCQILDELYKSKDLHHLLDNYTKLAINLNKTRQDEKTRKKLISRLAGNYVKYGRSEESAITRLTAYRRALELYVGINAKKEIEKTKAEMALLKDDLQNEMKPHGFKISLKQEIIDGFLKAAEETEYKKIPNLFGKCPYFVPKKEEMIKTVEEIPSLARVLMPTMILNEGNLIAESKTPEDRLQFDIYQFYQIQIIQEIAYIRQIMKELIEKGMFSKHNVMPFFFTNNDFFSDRSLKFIEDGVKRYFKADFVGAIHVLVPQIEAILRSMMQKLQIATTIRDRDGIREGDLGSYLRNPSVEQKILGEDFAMWLRVFLTEKAGGLNIRNYLAHGLIEFDQLTSEIASGILFILLRLGSLSLTDEQT